MLKTKKYDSADYIETKEDVAACLAVALAENDVSFFLETIGMIARSHGMSQIAKELNLARESLYHSLSADGNPSLETVIKVLDILGYQFSIEQKKRYQHQPKKKISLSTN
ncbi:MAG: putative addiction module antidote protein [Planctomycetaceae bacterium]|jgi:probable addiction module antidote protein|nr:putative addiction module antidote protein [Planctomycetaceae bacterium]